MIEDKINKKKVLKEARQLLKEGSSKQETFESLSKKFSNRKELSDIIAYMPSQIALKKYGIWNYILLAVLIALPVVMLFGAPPNVALLYFVLLIYIVLKRFLRYYVWITVVATVFLLSLFIYIFVGDITNINWLHFGSLAGLSVLLLILNIWLQSKLCPSPIEHEEEYVDKNGERKLKITYQFKY